MKTQVNLALFWHLKLIKTLFTYFNDKIKPKPSPDGTLSPNTLFHFPIANTALCVKRPSHVLNILFSQAEEKSDKTYLLQSAFERARSQTLKICPPKVPY